MIDGIRLVQNENGEFEEHDDTMPVYGVHRRDRKEDF